MIDAVVIGAGVVGLAVARALSERHPEILILEKEDSFGQATSSRNSEVIHAGLYHAPGTLKARLCVEGREKLYRYCVARGIGHRKCGKLIVASDAEQSVELERIRARGMANGVRGLAILTEAEARSLEPALRCVAALHSPVTGIVDSHGLMLALLGEAESRGARLVCRAAVTRLAREDGVWRVETSAGEEPVRARFVVNAAGLGAQAVAWATEGFPPREIPELFYAKGNYFSLAASAPFSRLIYPVPERAGAGIHFTLDLAGRARFGPDVQWVDDIDYHVAPARLDAFLASIRRYWPAVREEWLSPAYAGIRPKLAGPTEGGRDFAILGPEAHGLSGLVSLFGMESPGLTSAIAIGDYVAERLA